MDKVVGIAFVIVLIAISAFVAWESRETFHLQTRRGTRNTKSKKDESAFSHVSKRVQQFKLWPMIAFPHSGIKAISLWVILAVAYLGGVFSGFLGGGAGYVRMPSLVYVLGVPTHIAVGTDLFEIVISAGYGMVTHSLKGNVDIMIALVMNTGAAIGAQIGATCTEYFSGPKLRMAFIPLPLIGAALVIFKLITGQHLK